jgi:hypothetical protein
MIFGLHGPQPTVRMFAACSSSPVPAQTSLIVQWKSQLNSELSYHKSRLSEMAYHAQDDRQTAFSEGFAFWVDQSPLYSP